MRYTPEHSEETRARILDAAGRQFREHGYGSVGIDALARAAGVTSGAFYGHFRSKAAAFSATAATGLAGLRRAIEQYRQDHDGAWIVSFARFYLGRGHRADLAGGCALPSLTAAVGRADIATRSAFEQELRKVAAATSEDPARAWPLLALLAGGVLLARSVNDPALAEEIAGAVEAALPKLTADGAQSEPE